MFVICVQTTTISMIIAMDMSTVRVKPMFRWTMGCSDIRINQHQPTSRHQHDESWNYQKRRKNLNLTQTKHGICLNSKTHVWRCNRATPSTKPSFSQQNQHVVGLKASVRCIIFSCEPESQVLGTWRETWPGTRLDHVRISMRLPPSYHPSQ